MAKTKKKTRNSGSDDLDVADIINDLDIANDRLYSALDDRAKFPGRMPTGIATLDYAISRGRPGRDGLPYARLTVLSGPEGCGKSSLAAHIAGRFVRAGGVVLMIDSEGKADTSYIKQLGVKKLKKMALLQPEHLESGEEVIVKMCERLMTLTPESGKKPPFLVILDSIHGTPTKGELEKKGGAAGKNRVFSEALPVIFSKLHGYPYALLFISQYRVNLSSWRAFIQKVGGGNAVRYGVTLHLDMKSEEISGDPTGLLCKVTVRKNQIASPRGEGEYTLNANGRLGVDLDDALLRYGMSIGAIRKVKGGYYSIQKEGKEIKWRGGLGWTAAEKKNPGFKKWLRQFLHDLTIQAWKARTKVSSQTLDAFSQDGEKEASIKKSKSKTTQASKSSGSRQRKSSKRR